MLIHSGLEHIAREDGQWVSQAVDCTGVRKAVQAGVVAQQIIGRLELMPMKRTNEGEQSIMSHLSF